MYTVFPWSNAQMHQLLHAGYNEYDRVADLHNQGCTSQSSLPTAKAPPFDESASALSASFVHGWSGRYYSEAVDSKEWFRQNPAA